MPVARSRWRRGSLNAAVGVAQAAARRDVDQGGRALDGDVRGGQGDERRGWGGGGEKLRQERREQQERLRVGEGGEEFLARDGQRAYGRGSFGRVAVASARVPQGRHAQPDQVRHAEPAQDLERDGRFRQDRAEAEDNKGDQQREGGEPPGDPHQRVPGADQCGVAQAEQLIGPRDHRHEDGRREEDLPVDHVFNCGASDAKRPGDPARPPAEWGSLPSGPGRPSSPVRTGGVFYVPGASCPGLRGGRGRAGDRPSGGPRTRRCRWAGSP